jgi:ATP-binding cassette subfamily B protein
VQKQARDSYLRLLNEAAVPPKKQAGAVRQLLRERFGDTRFSEVWILRTPVGSSFRRFLGSAHAIANGSALIAAHTVQYVLWLISWTILGRLSLAGRMDRGWLAAWALLLVTLIPLRVCTTWLQGLVAVGVGAALKRRLLVGALRTEPQEIRHQGVGSFLGQAFEAEAVETLALSGGITGLLALIELVFSAFVLGQLALLLGVWCLLTAAVPRHFFSNYQRWTGCRMSMTADLVESMVGHRTRVAQQRQEDWHVSEDEALSEYLRRSRQIDFGGAWLVAALPRGWLVAGLIALAPSVISGSSTTSEVALRLGGILLAFTAFKKLTTSSVDIAAAVVAGIRILPLFRSAARTEPIGRTPPAGWQTEPAQKIVEADKVTFRYRKDGKPALYPSSLCH